MSKLPKDHPLAKLREFLKESHMSIEGAAGEDICSSEVFQGDSVRITCHKTGESWKLDAASVHDIDAYSRYNY